MLMTVGLFLVALALVSVVADVSVAFLARRDVAAACDAAAAAAAQGADRPTIYADGAHARVPLDLSTARAEVSSWLADQREKGLTARVDGLDNGDTTAVLTCHRPIKLPFSRFVGLHTVTVVAHARAVSPLR
jgi:Flp pilus assembly protein TadG